MGGTSLGARQDWMGSKAYWLNTGWIVFADVLIGEVLPKPIRCQGLHT